MQTTDQVINRTVFDKWNKTALGECGRYHEAQAKALRDMLRLGVTPSGRGVSVLQADIDMHEKFCTAILESQ